MLPCTSDLQLCKQRTGAYTNASLIMQVLIQEFTNYHFDVKPNALHGVLDRFAQFFIDPLCKADALEREVMAVDNEFSGTHSLGISGCYFAVSTCIVFSFSAKLMLPMDRYSSSCQSAK